MKIRLLSILCILLMSLSIEAQTEEFETAAEAVKNMKVGVNLGNTLESVSGELNNMWIEANTERRPQDYETAWGNPVTKAELMKMWRKAGYNAVRVPVSWYPHTGKIVIEYKPIKNEQGQEEIKPCWDFSKWEGYDVDPAWMKRVHEVVDYVIDQGMYCIINLHHDAGAPDGDKWVIADETNYEQNHERFEAIWRQIAEEFKDYDEHLLFEGYNEIVDKWNSWGDAYSFSEWSEVSPGVWGPTGHDEVIEQSIYRAVNKYAQSFVDAVRATGGNNKVRNLIVNTYCGYHSEKVLKNLSVPKDEIPNHIAFQLHYYVDVYDQNNDITKGKAYLDSMIEAWNRQLTPKGVPLIIGEWGFGIDPCPEKAFEYIRYFMERTRDNGIATFDFSGGYISYGDFRSFPAIINADYLNAVMKGYYGDSYKPSILTADDYELSVEFTDDHNEFYLCRELDTKYYDGFLLELDDYEEGRLELILVKSYDNYEIVEIPITSTKTYIDFKTLKLEESVKSIILRHKVAGNYNIGIKRSVLRYMDNSEQWSLGGDSNCNLKYKRKQFVHTIAYNDIWSELNLYDDDIPLKQKNYKGIRVEFAEPINADVFTLKIYADNGAVTEGKTLSAGTSATILFSDFPIEDVINRITLQYCKEGKTDVKVISAWLIRQDGTEEYSDLSPFWGCEIKEKTPYKAAASKEASNVTDQYLVNPSFNSDLHGWTNTGGTAKWKENTWEALNNFCEFEWTGSAIANQKVVQTITLPAGSYRLSVTCASDPGSSGLYLIAGSYSKEMPGTGGVDSFSLDFIVAKESAITIGMKVENTTATWVNFDNFKLERLESTRGGGELGETAAITIGKSGKASYCGEQSLDFSYSDEVKAYIATGFDKDEGTIWLTRVKDVPAGVPVLIKGGANKTYDVPVTDSENSYYTNMFVGNTSGEKIQIQETDGDMVNYYLSGDGTFKSVNKSANIGNNKCYLRLPGTFEAAATGAAQTVKIGSIGKASFAAPVDLDFTNVSGLKAFTATGYDKSTKTIWLTRVMKVQKGEGVLLKGDPNSYEIPSVAVQSSYMNMFVGNIGEKIQVPEKSEDGSQTNFYLNGDGAFVSVNGFVNIGNNKCYLELPTSMVAVASTRGAEANYLLEEPEVIKLPISFRSIDNDGDGTTGIKDQSSKFNAPSDNAYYTLQGQRVEKPGKGLYIKNGKKIVIK